MSTKLSISKKVSKKLNLSLIESKSITNYFLKLISSSAKYKKVKISGFGSFALMHSPEREGRNPKTKESYIIHARKKIIFKASNKVKKILN